jgi:cation diffusion facilitator family transporter
MVAGSVAVLSDGVDSSIDVIISLVMLTAAFVVRRPPSRKYPFGYDKAEGVATLALSFVVFFAGIQMLISTITTLVEGGTRAMPDNWAIYVTLFSIAGKLALAWYQFRVGKRAGSDLIIANAKNMRNDVLISVGVLLGLFFTFVLKMPILDTITGCVIALFILKNGVDIFRDAAVELMDGVRDQSVYRQIFDAVAQVPEAKNPHHVRIRQIGGSYMIDLDIELGGDVTVKEAHAVADRVEDVIRESITNVYDIEVHTEPLGAHHKTEPFGVEPNMLK